MSRQYDTAPEATGPASSAAPRAVQRNLEVGAADDCCEFEADQVADRVMRRLRSPVVGPDGGPLDSATESAIRRPAGGAPLPGPLKDRMEEAFGTDFGSVRIHTDPNAHRLARSISAEAFTAGSDIFFGSGRFRPETRAGQHLLAHELTHVVQQRGAGGHPPAARSTVSAPGDAAEREAERIADAAVRGDRVQVREAPDARVHRLAYTAMAANDVRRAQIEAKAEADYYDKAKEYEQRLGEAAAKHSESRRIADDMLDRVAKIVHAWAEATGLAEDRLLEQHLSWGGAGYGAIPAVAADIKKVIADKKDKIHIREKLTLVYSAARNNSLALWLKAAADELLTHAGATIKDYGAPGTRTLNAGFADASGLNDGNRLSNKLGQGSEVRKILAAEQGNATQSRSALMDWTDKQKGYDQDRMALEADAPHLIRHLRAKDIKNLSSREMRQGLTATPHKKLGWLEKRQLRGSKAQLRSAPGGQWYRVNVESKTATKARELKARLVAGVSGSTDLMLHAAEWLGITSDADKLALRLAILGWMLPARDHSWYEVMKAAKQYGVPFTKPPDGYGDVPPMSPADVRALLPKEGRSNVLPGYYLTDAYKDQLARKWLGKSGVEVPVATIDRLVRDSGLPRGMLETLSPEALSAVTALAAEAAKVTFVAAGNNEAQKARNSRTYAGLQTCGAMKKLSKAAGRQALLLLAGIVQARIDAGSSDFVPPAPHGEFVRAARVQKAHVDTTGADKQLSQGELNALPGNAISWNVLGSQGDLDANKRLFTRDEQAAGRAAPDYSAYDALHGKERGAISNYSKLGFKQMVPAMLQLGTDGGDTSLQKALPRVEALTSGLHKLPVYSGTVYRLEGWGIAGWFRQLKGPWRDRERQLARRLDASFGTGKILVRSYPMSSTKDLKENIDLNTAGVEFDVVLVIESVKSGRDIQVLSLNYGEAEVLFPPGARLVVTRYEHNLDVPLRQIRRGKENAAEDDAQKYIEFNRAKIFVYCKEV